MNLTNDQKQALEKGNAVPVTVDETRYVIVREDVFEKLKSLPVAYDDGDFPISEIYPAILAAWDKDDENPEQYLEYLEDK